MSIFEALYADYYDVFYAQKPYEKEVAAVTSLFSLSDAPVHKIVSLGCGTMSHELLLAKQGQQIFGIDQSPRMVALANEAISLNGLASSMTVSEGDMRSFEVSEKMDAAISLFNVISYCGSVDELEQVFQSVAKALRVGGIFVFDCWYGEAVRFDPPKDRWNIFSKGDLELIRLTKMEHLPDKNQILLDIDLIEHDQKQILRRTKERHEVRYWDISELEQAAKKASMKIVQTSSFPNVSLPISKEMWSMAVVARLENL